jgi:hypothetical protein
MAMSNERALIYKAYKEQKIYLTHAIIKDLISLNKKDFLQSGEDSGLRNVWEEICVQVQGEFSYFWGIHDKLIQDTIKIIYDAQDESFKSLVETVVAQKITRVPFFESVYKNVILEAKRNKNERVKRYNRKEEDEF